MPTNRWSRTSKDADLVRKLFSDKEFNATKYAPLLLHQARPEFSKYNLHNFSNNIKRIAEEIKGKKPRKKQKRKEHEGTTRQEEVIRFFGQHKQ